MPCNHPTHPHSTSAAPQQLELLGRELKCPICLCLFNQAASLSCNHNFCFSCISQSMKRTPLCPICKVPTTRREVRAAPQMDSLVNIYKSMETAASIDLPATQGAVADPASEPCLVERGEGNKVNSNKHKLLSVIGINEDVANPDPRKKRQRCKYRQPLSNITNDAREAKSRSPEQGLKGFIPTKKRVQVPRFSLLNGEMGFDNNETNAMGAPLTGKPRSSYSLRIESKVVRRRERRMAKRQNTVAPAHTEEAQCSAGNKMSHRQNEDLELRLSTFGPQKCSTEAGRLLSAPVKENKVVDPDDGGRPRLDPFFWLREESSEDIDCTQTQVQATQLSLIQPSWRPTFSDLKDSDDDSLIGQENEVSIYSLAEVDSHITDTVELTHAPASTPLNMQAVNKLDKETVLIGLPLEGTDHDLVTYTYNGKEPEREVHKKYPSQSLHLLETGTDFNAIASGKKTNKVPRAKGYTLKGKLQKSSRQSYSVGNSESQHQLIRKRSRNKPCRKSQQVRDSAVDPDSIKASRETFLNADKVYDAMLGKGKVAVRSCDIQTGRKICNSGSRPEASQPSVKGRAKLGSNRSVCSFCLTLGNSELAGPLICYKDGVPVEITEDMDKVVFAHKLCAEWAPNVYFVDDVAIHLLAEVVRGQKIKCNCCGKKGAALGCCLKRCHRSYHYPCARAISCRWNDNEFIILCPEHATSKFPQECRKRQAANMNKSDVEIAANADAAASIEVTGEKFAKKWPLGPSSKWVLCGSGLNSSEKEQLASFVKRTGATAAKVWTSNVSHVIAGTNDQGVARRTLKLLMGTLEGKWVLRPEWMAACIAEGKPVNEGPFEIHLDNHGMVDGPKRGRSLAAAKAPKLFDGIDIFLSGEYAAAYKGDLQALLVAAGGGLLHRKPVRVEGKGVMGEKRTIVIFNKDLPSSGGMEDAEREIERRQMEAKALAAWVGAAVAAHTWILDSIAACELQPLE